MSAMMMRILLFILLFTVVCTLTWAQDTTVHEKKGIISNIRQKLKDSSRKISQPSLSRSTLRDTLNPSNSDSLVLKQNLDSVQYLPSQNKVKFAEKAIDTVNQKSSLVSAKVDSLQHQLDKPVDEVNKKISSAESSTKQKLEGINQSIDQKTTQFENKMHQGFNKATDGEVKAPDNLNIPNSELKLSTIDAGIEGVDVPRGIQGLNADIPEANIPSVKENDKLNVNGLKEKLDIDIPQEEKIKNVTGEINKTDSKLVEAEKYESELRQIKDGDLRSTEAISQKAEEKVASIEQVSSVSGDMQKVTQQQAQYEAMIQKYRDKKMMQEEVMRKAKNVANDKLNKFTPAVKDAEQQIAKARKLNPAVKSLNEITKRTNPMKDRPFFERLVPGITLQVYNTDIFTMDWGAQLGYKLSGKFVMGAGGVYRLGVNKNFPSRVKGLDVYGYRAYSSFTLFKGFYILGELESLHAPASIHRFTKAEISTHRVYNGNFGLGKRYDISKKIRGSVLVLYRAEIDGYMPSVSKVNLRVGFDYNTKKQKKIKF